MLPYVPKPLKLIQVPQDISTRKDLSGNEKLLLGVIIYLVKRRGFTKAGNQFIGECMGLCAETISNILSKLRHRNVLQVHVHRTVKGKVWGREFNISRE